ncbi:bacteriohemerythrin [Maridesulfovibrio sp.]|uniref:bacteriohemerythrin n=1 Tax=Maridesulfovibrio sp. TaxID=2795000 RepID=UPI0029F5A2C9|nr:bacteriohemerythrin [Maridesulfovibrio sp.]
MPILKWDENYSAGVKILDDEHKQLIAMINKAYDSVTNMEEDIVLRELVKEMRAYAASHFATEDNLMNTYGYPALAEHLEMHESFAVKAEALNNLVSSGDKVDPVKVFKLLADWLRDHIMKTDKELGKFLNEQGVK